MHNQLLLRTLPRVARPSVTLARSLHCSPSTLASKPAHEPASTQGHTTKKAHETLHKDQDIQSHNVRKGQKARAESTQSSSGENEPFDAARQGNTGGESKGRAEGATGSFADQVGGQDEAKKGAGATKGGSETAAGYNITETVANKVQSGFDNLKKMRSDGRNFSTSARAYNGTTPRTDPDGARKTVEKDVAGDQNAHLKHTAEGSDGKAASGNASANPSLPSKKGSSDLNDPHLGSKQSMQGSQSRRGFSTSMRVLADPNTPSDSTPRPAQKDAAVQSGLKQQPRGSEVEHGGAAGEPTSGATSANESTANPASETAAPDPGIPEKQKVGSHANQTKRGFSTSARAMADPNTPSDSTPRPAQKDAAAQSGLKQQPRGDDAQHGGSAGQPTSGVTSANESTADPASNTAAPDPGVSKKEKGGATKSGMGVRDFSTSARASAASPPQGYAKAQDPEHRQAGYNSPPTALPSGLKSAYEEQDPNAVQAAGSGSIPSSQIPHSSSAVDPPNETLRQAALDGTLGEKNPQPDVPGTETGRQGLDEAWKHRK